MKTKCITILALTVSLSAFNMVAQPNERPQQPKPGQRPDGGPGHRMPVPPVFAALDANHDGTISADEIANASAALKGLDKNGDGQLTAEEIRPARPDGEGRGPGAGPRPSGEKRPEGERKGPPPLGGAKGENFHPPVPPIIAALDANGDKTISADEIDKAANALKALDKNGDGALQKEEMRPEPPPRREN